MPWIVSTRNEPRRVSAATTAPTRRRIAGSIARSQPQISRDSTRTQTVITVLKKNMTGRKNTMTSASSAVPNSCVVRKLRIFPISWKLWRKAPVSVRSK